MSSQLSLAMVAVFLLCSYTLAAQISADSIPPLVDSLIQVSRAHTGNTEFEEASAASKLAGEAALDCCGENSAAYAAYLFNEGRIRDFMGRLKESLPWYIQSRELRGQVLGTDHVEYGKSCNNLAITYDVMGRYEEAEPLYLEVLAIREVVYGRRSTTCAAILANLGGMYSSMGDNDVAEQMILEALDIRRELLGEDHQLFGQNLVLLASHYLGIRNDRDAEPLLLQAKDIFEAQEQLDFYDYLSVLEHLGDLYESLSDFEAAKTYLEQAAELIERALGKDNRTYAASLNYLAALAFSAGELEKSEAYLKEELTILKQLGYQENQDYGVALQDLSQIYHRRGESLLALETLDQGLEILAKALPPSHKWYRNALWDKATIEQSLGNFQSAADLYRRIATLEQQPLANAIRHLSDQELSAFTKEYYWYLSRSLALAEDYPAVADLFYDRILLYKGFLLDNAVAVRQNSQKDESTRILYRQLKGYHRRLAALYSDYQADEEEIRELEEMAELVEKELVRNQAQYARLSFNFNWQQLQAQLLPSEASIELVAYQKAANVNQPFEGYYAALLLLPEVNQPIFVGLGAEEDLAELLNVATGNQEAINDLYQWGSSGQQLYQLVWGPIQATLDQYPAIKKVYLSGDGLMHRLNISAIPNPDNKAIGQRYEIVVLNSTRNLLNKQQKEAVASQQTAVLYGGIDYGTTELSSTANKSMEDTSIDSRRGAYNNTLRGYDPESGYWQSLPWTEVETEYAKEVLQEAGYAATLYTGDLASEAQFKEIVSAESSPNLIHLATHGYFFEPPETKNKANLLPFARAEEDLIRSGLILADGNYAWSYGHSRTIDTEDGILTALEISQLELDDTELVILSACETGLGKIQQTEGVYGLQRALKLAGVKYIIISLWQVPDYQAQAFMSTFYLAWLEESKSIPEAFQDAQAYMRARYKNPFEWAGFMLIQ